MARELVPSTQKYCLEHICLYGGHSNAIETEIKLHTQTLPLLLQPRYLLLYQPANDSSKFFTVIGFILSKPVSFNTSTVNEYGVCCMTLTNDSACNEQSFSHSTCVLILLLPHHQTRSKGVDSDDQQVTVVHCVGSERYTFI